MSSTPDDIVQAGVTIAHPHRRHVPLAIRLEALSLREVSLHLSGNKPSKRCDTRENPRETQWANMNAIHSPSRQRGDEPWMRCDEREWPNLRNVLDRKLIRAGPLSVRKPNMIRDC
jgi:hypothetical protein